MIFAQSDRLEPELANESLALNMYVSRFVAIETVKVEPISSLNKYGGHACCPGGSDCHLQSRCSKADSMIIHRVAV